MNFGNIRNTGARYRHQMTVAGWEKFAVGSVKIPCGPRLPPASTRDLLGGIDRSTEETLVKN